MATQHLIDSLKGELQSLAAYTDIDLVSRKDKWGSINFEEARADIDLALSVATDLLDLPLQYLTDTTAQQIIDYVPGVVGGLAEIDQFSLEGGDPVSRRDNLSQNLHAQVEALYAVAGSSIPYLAYRRGDATDNITKLNQAVADAGKILEEAKKSADDKNSEIEEIIKAARAAAASTGVATFTEEFRDEASTLGARSKNWLIATAVFAALTIGAAIGSYFWPEVSPKADGWETLRNVASKVAIIAVLFTGTIWCGRIYRALIHQATVNKHRALSLKTFQAFVKAADDPYVRDAVLMAATKTVFGSVPTGLVEYESSQDQGVNFVEFGKRPSGEKVTEAATEMLDG
ncbi:MAG: hypothetical protein OXC38_06300 [Gammaproteobacteria bacterium]|nr:hypothetical protein [Gammaproteobacteria bacterium]